MPIQHLETDIARGHGQTLGAFSGQIQQSTQALGQSAAALAGAWRGPSSDQFADLMEPELRRLAQLADDGLTLRDRLMREVDEWERVDSRFGDAVAGGAGGVTGPGSGASAPTAPPAEAPPPVFVLNDLLDYNPNYPDGLGDTMESMHGHFMNCVRGDCPDSDIYREMAEMTGLSEEEVREQFNKAVETAREAGLDDNNPAFNSLGFPNNDHWGSRRQLLFGKVVGDHLGIHPVFAAFLSPSGGLIGPGDQAAVTVLEAGLSGMFSENAWDYHGAAHDAFGYLYNNHDMGPGYQYIQSPLNDLDLHGTEDSLSGQFSGYGYWAEQLGLPKVTLDAVAHIVVPPWVPFVF